MGRRRWLSCCILFINYLHITLAASVWYHKEKEKNVININFQWRHSSFLTLSSFGVVLSRFRLSRTVNRFILTFCWEVLLKKNRFMTHESIHESILYYITIHDVKWIVIHDSQYLRIDSALVSQWTPFGEYQTTFMHACRTRVALAAQVGRASACFLTLLYLLNFSSRVLRPWIQELAVPTNGIRWPFSYSYAHGWIVFLSKGHLFVHSLKK